MTIYHQSEERINSLHVQRIRTSEEFYSLNDKWNNLLEGSPVNTIFLRWEWLWSWWNAYKEREYELCILLVYSADDLIGIAPFYIVHRRLGNIFPVRRLLLLGTKEGSVISEYMDIIYRAGKEDSVIKKIIEYIELENICDDICLHKIDTSSKSIPLIQKVSKDTGYLCNIYDRFESPYIALPTDYNDFLNSLSSSMRYKIRRNKRRLEKYRGVIINKTSNITELEENFIELIRLHQARWNERKMKGSFSDEKFVIFHKMVMQYLLNHGYLYLSFLSIDNKNIASLYNIKYKNKVYFYQSGTDISFDHGLSPGLLLHSYCIEEAIKEGLEEYDFMIKGEMDSYKKSWTKNYRYMCDIYIVRPKVLKFLTSLKDKARHCYHTIKVLR